MDVHSYIKQLYDYMTFQQKEISGLKEAISLLNTEIKKLKEKPSVTVERLEYKFDQLKVETLEGTLNIGLNPSDLNTMDEFSVPTPAPTNIVNPALKGVFFKRPLSEKIDEYLNNQLETVVNDTEHQTGMRIENNNIEHMKENLRKQIPARIDHYIHTYGSQQNEEQSEEQLFENIYNTIVADINKAVHAFITQMPQSGKE
ncbi:spore germination protein GerPC [Lederbergia citrea]|uniref:Uncharacterized protein n=1 Tax=Lederbergia citrea TaxID=2833581 RepID=A0A942Z396_9BACI|nr:spore germination protein GerPC [Lederbergia citrea]MBS4177430.1 hypothetical protein [Lederbergia citrea]MBS4204108.1 hypothetical protein [Lederbergia citrea]MBS4221307.1 hypothetical protein [Lederbergia citrea]